MRVAVIDDSATICKIIEVALGREGHQVMSFPDGVAALQVLALPHIPAPELVFLDIDLPKLNGYQVLRAFKERPQLAHVPVVMISRYCGVVERLKARLAGAQVFLSKPFTVSQLVAVASNYTSKQGGGSCSR